MSRLTEIMLRERHGKLEVRLQNMVRRMSMAATSAIAWAVEGFEDRFGNREKIEDVEVFGTAGVISRPAATAKAEAVVAHLGGDTAAPLVLATRDVDAIKAFEVANLAELGAGETAIINGAGAFIKIDASGTITISPGASGFVRIAKGAAIAGTLLPGINGVMTGLDVEPILGIPFSMFGNGSSVIMGSKV